LARVIYSDEALEDLERIIEFLLATSPETAGAALGQIRGAVSVLAAHPQIGRRVDVHRRELVISHGATGYLAHYRYDARPDLVRVLRVRHQREAGYRD
jgi:plasmid stabilization system protein ParE